MASIYKLPTNADGKFIDPPVGSWSSVFGWRGQESRCIEFCRFTEVSLWTSSSSCEYMSVLTVLVLSVLTVLVTVTGLRSQHYRNHLRHQRLVWFSCKHISADCRLTQSAEMTAWAVNQVPAHFTDCCYSQVSLWAVHYTSHSLCFAIVNPAVIIWDITIQL